MAEMGNSKTIASWYFEQEKEFGGFYPQVSGKTSSEVFRDSYRRCIAVFFATARIANPEASLVLYLNKPWSSRSSKIARKTLQILEDLSVEIRVIQFTYARLAKQDAWKNQFFVLDILSDLSERLAPRDIMVLLDSDVVWLNVKKDFDIWQVMEKDGHFLMDIDYLVDERINDSSRRELTRIYNELQHLSEKKPLSYFGGELIGLTGENLKRLNQIIDETLMLLDSDLEIGEEMIGINFAEEAYFLSYCFKIMGIEIGNCDEHMKRIWTMFAKERNASNNDLKLQLWHLPAEKNYGIRRIYREYLGGKMQIKSLELLLRCPEEAGRRLGVPKNSLFKIIADLSYAVIRRFYKLTGKL